MTEAIGWSCVAAVLAIEVARTARVWLRERRLTRQCQIEQDRLTRGYLTACGTTDAPES